MLLFLSIIIIGYLLLGTRKNRNSREKIFISVSLVIILNLFVYSYVIPVHPKLPLLTSSPEHINVGISSYNIHPFVEEEDKELVIGLLRELRLSTYMKMEGHPGDDIYEVSIFYDKLIGASVIRVVFYENLDGDGFNGLIIHSYVDGISYLHNDYYEIKDEISVELAEYINSRIEQFKSEHE